MSRRSRTKVYAVGIYCDATGACRVLEGWRRGGAASGALGDALLSADPATFFPRALHMVFARDVTGAQVSDALAEKLKQAVAPEAFAKFSEALLAGIGPKGLSQVRV